MADRLQREIDEIVSRMEGFPPKRRFWSRLRDAAKGFLSRLKSFVAALPRPRLSLGQLMLLGGALIIVAYVFGIGSPSVNRLLIGAGLALFFLAFILSLRRTARAPEKRWRGEPMELQASVGHRLRSWWERWRSRR